MDAIDQSNKAHSFQPLLIVKPNRKIMQDEKTTLHFLEIFSLGLYSSSSEVNPRHHHSNPTGKVGMKPLQKGSGKKANIHFLRDSQLQEKSPLF